MSGAEASLVVILGVALGFVLGLVAGVLLRCWVRRLEVRTRFDDDVEAIIERQRREGR